MTYQQEQSMCYWLYTTAYARKLSRELGIEFEAALLEVKKKVKVEQLVINEELNCSA